MPIKLSQVSADPKKIDGTWIEFGDGCRFKLASTTRDAYQKALTRARPKSRFELEKDDAGMKIVTVAVREACLLDWEGIVEEDGVTPIPFSVENKKRIMDVPLFREFITAAANEISNFQEEAKAEDAATLKSGAGVGTGVGTAPEGPPPNS